MGIINDHAMPTEFRENSFVTKDCCIPGDIGINCHAMPHNAFGQIRLTMNSVFYKINVYLELLLFG